MCRHDFARSAPPGTGWHREVRDPVPEMSLGCPCLYIQLRGGHTLAGDLSHALEQWWHMDASASSVFIR
jgi:hypothetical protein